MPKEILDFILILLWQILKTWWWALAFIVLWRLFWPAWLWWRRELWESKEKYVLLEIITPAEVMQPISAMEQVFSVLWGIYSSVEGLHNLRKKWLWGRKLYHFCIEIVSFGPDTRLLLRMREEHCDSVKAALYSQYPGVEIKEVDDYTRYISQNIPNKDWNIYGLDEFPIKPDVYPIKTYRMFFEERPELVKEEKRIDPLASLLEGLALLKERKEIIWIQIRATPVSSKDNNCQERAKRIVDELVHRAKKRPSIIEELITGPPSGRKEAIKAGEGFIPPEMKLTAREKEIVKAVEDKVSKPVFETNIRVLYFGRPDVFGMGRRSLAENFFNSFSTRDLNALKKWRATKTRVYHLFVKRRLYMRRRNIFWRYVLRETPLYPQKGGTFILNAEELATIFHPPLAVRAVGTRLPRVEARKGEPPGKLPIEETLEEEPGSVDATTQQGTRLPRVESRKGEFPAELPIEETPEEESESAEE